MNQIRSGPVSILLSGALSVLLHVTLGWESTLLAGIVGGFLSPRRYGLAGSAGVALGWTVLVGYTAAVAPASFRVFLGTMEAFVGTFPGEAVVGLTVFIGAVLGALGGGIGALLRLNVEEARAAEE